MWILHYSDHFNYVWNSYSLEHITAYVNINVWRLNPHRDEAILAWISV